jgi:hypothetical protein
MPEKKWRHFSKRGVVTFSSISGYFTYSLKKTNRQKKGNQRKIQCQLNIGAEHPGFKQLNTSRHASNTAVRKPQRHST